MMMIETMIDVLKTLKFTQKQQKQQLSSRTSLTKCSTSKQLSTCCNRQRQTPNVFRQTDLANQYEINGNENNSRRRKQRIDNNNNNYDIILPQCAYVRWLLLTVVYASMMMMLMITTTVIDAKHQHHHLRANSNEESTPVVIANTAGLLGNPQEEPYIVVPEADYDGNVTRDAKFKANMIDNKRFIESMSTRCFSSTLMDDPKLFEPTFYLFKQQAEMKLRPTFQPDDILAAGFDPTKWTYVFVHGFTQSYPDTVWLRHARALFERQQLKLDTNIIIMDWSRAANQKYSQAAAYVSSMGAYLANFLQKLLELGLNRNKVHLIGHSLGAHVVGFAGKRIRNRLGRITALDAAGPCFGKVASNGPSDRLTPDDALEVDVYHYDDDFLGIGPNVQLGQHDVYVNGGSKQPGCKPEADQMFDAAITVMTGRNRVLSESHTRSTEVATAWLGDSQCQQVAYACKSWPSFTRGECGYCDKHNNQCFFMGLPFQYGRLANNSPYPNSPLRPTFPGKKYYISTSGEPPFCQQHYQILIRLEQTQELKATSSGGIDLTFELDLFSSDGGQANATVTNRLSTNVYSHLLLVEGPPVSIDRVLIGVNQPSGWSNPFNWINGESNGGKASAGGKWVNSDGLKLLQVDINFMSNIAEEKRRQFSSSLCVQGPVRGRQGVLELASCRQARGSLIR